MKVWALPPVGGGLGLGVDKVDKEQIRVESEYKTRRKSADTPPAPPHSLECVHLPVDVMTRILQSVMTRITCQRRR